MNDSKLDDLQSIEYLIHNYFDGLYYSRADLLARVFHPDAIYACSTSGELVHYFMPEYFELVKNRVSPHDLGQPRNDLVVSIELPGNHAAVVRLKCCIAPKFFNDVLSLIKLHGKWWIMAKIFDYEQAELPHNAG